MLKNLLSLFSSILLLSLSTVHATPPSTPILNVQTQGLSVEAEWSATGATGYRLFYADTNSGKVEVADMGSMNQISAVLEHGTAMSLYVQAYNADGDSAYSEVKTFVINDPSVDKTPEMLQADVQDLTFQAVFLDTPAAFLPTNEDIEAQERTVRSAGDKNVTYGPEFEDGRIAMTLHIAPALVHRASLELSFCLSVADSCESLLVWNSERQGYTSTMTVRDLPNDVEKSVYLELLMPKTLVGKLRRQGTKEQEAVVYASEVNSRNPATQMVQVAQIPVIDLGERGTRSTRGTSSLKITTPQFGKDFNNSMFGVKFAIAPELWIYKTYGVTGSDQKAGAQLGATGDITATILGNTFSVMTVKGYATKNSGKRLTRGVSIKILSANIYDKQASKKPGAPAQVTQVSNTVPGTDPNWLDCFTNGTPNTTAQCSIPPASDAGDGEGGGEGDEGSNTSNIFSYVKTIEKGYSTMYVIVFVPVQASLGAQGTAALNIGAGVEITTAPIGLKVSGGGGPEANIGGYARAGVSILIASAGIEGTISLIGDILALNTIANLKISPFDLTFGGNVTNTLTGPTGTVSLYATYIVPAWALPPWKEKKVTKTLISWTTFELPFTLLQWGADGSKTSDDNKVMADLNNAASSSSGEPMPVFTDKEPTVATDGPSWVCVYSTNVAHTFPIMGSDGIPTLCSASTTGADKNQYVKTEVGPEVRSCTQIPAAPSGQAEYQEVGFNISSMDKGRINHREKCPPGAPGMQYPSDWFDESWGNFANNVTRIKIWGPLRVALFTGANRTGASAYWYTNSGEIEDINLTKDYLLGKSQSLLMTRIGVQDSQKTPPTFNVCFYENENQGGQSFCFPTESGGSTKLSSYSDAKISGNDVSFIGNYWNDKPSSVTLTGYGAVCVYNDSNFSGYQSCWLGQGKTFNFGLAGTNDKISSFKVMPTPTLALVDNLNGSLEEAGTSSLPNSNMLASGALSGFYGGSINSIYNSNQASVAALKGPLTVILKGGADGNSGNRSAFYLDSDEWDVTYLNGINDDVETWTTWPQNCYQGGQNTCADNSGTGSLNIHYSSATDIVNKKTAKCISSASSVGQAVSQGACGGPVGWQLGFFSDGYSIVNTVSLQAESNSENARVIAGQFVWNAGWQLVNVGNGYYNIVHKASGKCLGLDTKATDINSAGLVLATCYSVDDMLWKFPNVTETLTATQSTYPTERLVFSNPFHLFNRAGGYCLFFDTTSETIRYNSQACTSAPMWVSAPYKGNYLIQHQPTGKCVDSSFFRLQNCYDVTSSDAINTGAESTWQFTDVGNGYSMISYKGRNDGCLFLADSGIQRLQCNKADYREHWKQNTTSFTAPPPEKSPLADVVQMNLINKKSGKCAIRVSSGSVKSDTCPTNPYWTVGKAVGGDFAISNSEKLCIGDAGYGRESSVVAVAACDNANYNWRFSDVGGGYYVIHNTVTSQCLYEKDSSLWVSICNTSKDEMLWKTTKAPTSTVPTPTYTSQLNQVDGIKMSIYNKKSKGYLSNGSSSEAGITYFVAPATVTPSGSYSGGENLLVAKQTDNSVIMKTDAGCLFNATASNAGIQFKKLQLQTGPCDYSSTTNWTLLDAGNGDYFIYIGGSTQQCLYESNGQLKLSNCYSGMDEMLWKTSQKPPITVSASTVNMPKNPNATVTVLKAFCVSQYCLGVGASETPGVKKVSLEKSFPSTYWEVKDQGNGYFTITKDGFCLGAYGDQYNSQLRLVESGAMSVVVGNSFISVGCDSKDDRIYWKFPNDVGKATFKILNKYFGDKQSLQYSSGNNSVYLGGYSNTNLYNEWVSPLTEVPGNGAEVKLKATTNAINLCISLNAQKQAVLGDCNSSTVTKFKFLALSTGKGFLWSLGKDCISWINDGQMSLSRCDTTNSDLWWNLYGNGESYVLKGSRNNDYCLTYNQQGNVVVTNMCTGGYNYGAIWQVVK